MWSLIWPKEGFIFREWTGSSMSWRPSSGRTIECLRIFQKDEWREALPLWFLTFQWSLTQSSTILLSWVLFLDICCICPWLLWTSLRRPTLGFLSKAILFFRSNEREIIVCWNDSHDFCPFYRLSFFPPLMWKVTKASSYQWFLSTWQYLSRMKWDDNYDWCSFG